MVALITNSDDADDADDDSKDADYEDDADDDTDRPPSAPFKALLDNYGRFDKGGYTCRVTGRPKIWHC